MYLAWHVKGWEDYVAWQTQDKRTLKRINALLKDIMRDPLFLAGLDDPEKLKYDLTGEFSRKIDEFNRLVYTIFWKLRFCSALQRAL
jgi:toxin YoeB